MTRISFHFTTFHIACFIQFNFCAIDRSFRPFHSKCLGWLRLIDLYKSPTIKHYYINILRILLSLPIFITLIYISSSIKRTIDSTLDSIMKTNIRIVITNISSINSFHSINFIFTFFSTSFFNYSNDDIAIYSVQFWSHIRLTLLIWRFHYTVINFIYYTDSCARWRASSRFCTNLWWYLARLYCIFAKKATNMRLTIWKKQEWNEDECRGINLLYSTYNNLYEINPYYFYIGLYTWM